MRHIAGAKKQTHGEKNSVQGKGLGKIPLGYLRIGDINEKDFMDFLAQGFEAMKESSIKTYVKFLRRILLFAKQQGYSLQDIVDDPEGFFLEFARSKGLDENRIRSPRSMFFKCVVPFLHKEAEQGKDISGEVLFPEKREKETRKQTEREIQVKDLRTPPPDIQIISRLIEEKEKEIKDKLQSVVESIAKIVQANLPSRYERHTPEDGFKSLSFPCIILFSIPGEKNPIHIVALEKIKEDKHILKVRGFIVEKWVEDITLYEKMKRRDKNISRPQPAIEPYGILKRGIVLIKDIESGVHEPNAILKEIEPIVRKLKSSKPTTTYHEEQEDMSYIPVYL